MNYSNIGSFAGAVAITATGLFLMAPPASAHAPIVVLASGDVVTRHISYVDLNLASPSGAKTLTGRVNYAVRDLCSEATGSGDDASFTLKFADRKCRNAAWNQARPQISHAIQRATEIASTGSSMIAATAITISLSE
jgi:UrcA family protein